MSRALQFSPEAIVSLQSIYDHIAPRGGKQIEASYFARIHKHCLGLSTFPERDRIALLYSTSRKHERNGMLSPIEFGRQNRTQAESV